MANTVTKDFIIDAAQKLENFYMQRNVNMRAWREMVLLSQDSYWIDSTGTYVPPEDKEVRIVLPVAYSLIQSYLSLMLTRPPVIDVPPSTVRDVHQEDADNIERMLYAIWYKSRVNRVVRSALWHALAEGWGVIQIVYDPEADLASECPIFARDVDPLGVYPMPSTRPGEWEYVITVEHRLVGDLRNAFVLGKDGRRKAVKTARTALADLDDTERVRTLEYWDAEQHAYMIIPTPSEAEQPEVELGRWLLSPTAHDFGQIPFVFFFGDELPFRDRGERMGISVLYPVEQLIRYFCQLMSQKATVIARYANPTLVTKTAEGRGFEMHEPYGGQLPLELDESAEYLLPPGTSPSIDVQLGEIVGQLEQAGLPRHIMGQLTVGRLSGIAMNLLRTPVLMKVAYKQMCVEEALEQMNTLFLRVIENYLTAPLYIWGRDSEGEAIEVALDPAKISGYYRNRVRLTASLPTDETAIAAMLTALKQIDVLSSRTVRDIMQQTLRDLASQSLEGEEDQILIEKLLSLPQIQLALGQDAAREAGVAFPMETGGGPQAPMQGALPGFGGNQGFAPQQLPWRMQGRAQPTVPDMIRRLARQAEGAEGGRPPSGIGAPTGPTSVVEE